MGFFGTWNLEKSIYMDDFGSFWRLWLDGEALSPFGTEDGRKAETGIPLM